MVSWSFLSSHARVLVCIVRDPGARLRDIAASVGITERSAHAIVSDLAGAGYVVRQKDGRRNRYQIQPTYRCPRPVREDSPSATFSPSSPARDPHHRTARPRDP
jgi:MarR family